MGGLKQCFYEGYFLSSICILNSQNLDFKIFKN